MPQDGGCGARGFLQLQIMKRIMTRVQAERNEAGLNFNHSTGPPPPCNFFDAIGGSDTGGYARCRYENILAKSRTRFLAIMFSKLGMTVDEASEAYEKVCKEVYVGGLNAATRTAAFRTCIEGLLEERNLPKDLKLGQQWPGLPTDCVW
jgi:hypothetical protein